MPRWRPPSDLDPVDPTGGVDRALRRAWGFARPYRRLLAGQLAGLAAAAFAAILPPLVLKALVDRAPEGSRDTGDLNGWWPPRSAWPW